MLVEVRTEARSVAGIRCVAPVGDLNNTYITTWVRKLIQLGKIRK